MFQQTVVLVCVVLLIVILFVVARTMKKHSDKLVETPTIGDCPDYWTPLSGGKCKNTNKLGSCNTDDNNNVMDFSDPTYAGPTGKCQKYQWATRCGVAWDGLNKTDCCSGSVTTTRT